MAERERDEGTEPSGETWPPDRLITPVADAIEESDDCRGSDVSWLDAARAALSCPAVTQYVEGLRRELAVQAGRAERYDLQATALVNERDALRRERDEAVEALTAMAKHLGYLLAQYERVVDTVRLIKMDTPEDRELHDRAVAMFDLAAEPTRALLDWARAREQGGERVQS